MNNMKKVILSAMAILTSFNAYADDHEEAKVKHAEHIPGTWKRTWISSDGNPVSMTKVIKADKEDNHFIETITTSEEGAEILNKAEKNQVKSKWELLFKVESVTGNMLKFTSIKRRGFNMEDSKWSDWKEAGFHYLFQVDEFFWNEVMKDLDNSTKRRFSRVTDNIEDQPYHELAKRKLSILKPMLGKWEGSVEQVGVKAYGLPAHTQKIKHVVSLNENGTIMTWQWQSQNFDVVGAQSYNSTKGAIVTNYHTSSGVQISGTLISSSDNKFLWERSGDTPKGFLYEKCLLDLSEEGLFRHKVMDRTLNGVTQPEEPVIILKRVE
jgi:hypothetical protein